MGLIERARSGDQSALARLATLIENDDPAALAALDQLGVPAASIHVVGVTGPPGAGKSTLINSLLPRLREAGHRIAVLLIDPSSQTTGGAVLGDRVRMLSWGDQAVFIRSQATRGQEGGLAPSTAALIDLFAHMGFDLVLIETVGVGQDGIDIRAVCETTIVVQSPNLGDSVQSLKAGILEIADIFAVTKSDLPGSQQTVRDLNAMMLLVHPESDSWSVPVTPVSASEGTGFDDLARQLAAHHSFITAGGRSLNRLSRLKWETFKRAEARIAGAIRSIDESSWSDMSSRDERVTALLSFALRDPSQPD